MTFISRPAGPQNVLSVSAVGRRNCHIATCAWSMTVVQTSEVGPSFVVGSEMLRGRGAFANNVGPATGHLWWDVGHSMA